MKPLRWIAAVALLTVTPGMVRAGGPDHRATIIGEGQCQDSTGLEMEGVEGSMAKFACFENRAVQLQCGADGRLARLYAYRQWMKNLDQFQRQCDANRGTFSFVDPSFKEPQSEAFCSQAAVHVEYGQFENAICQFYSECPAVEVVCASDDRLPTWHIPPQAVALPGVPIPVPVR